MLSEYKTKDLAYVGGATTKYVPIGDRVEVKGDARLADAADYLASRLLASVPYKRRSAS